jgi:hypothetical protein
MEIDTQTEHSGYRGHWAGPAAVVVLVGLALVLLAWLEFGLVQALF